LRIAVKLDGGQAFAGTAGARLFVAGQRDRAGPSIHQEADYGEPWIPLSGGLYVAEILSGLKSASCGEQIVLSQTAVSGCYKGSFVIPCISSLLAAVRIFFLSRTDMALKSSPCDSNSPSLNGNALGPR
jgi:hypothetical protein